jgi:hypothetical protein
VFANPVQALAAADDLIEFKKKWWSQAGSNR